jgi:hypothetical protein
VRIPSVQGAGTGAALIALAATTGGIETLPDVARTASRDAVVVDPDPAFAGVGEPAARLVAAFEQQGWWRARTADEPADGVRP